MGLSTANAPVVTVVIPTYNGRRFLGVVLQALSRQTIPGEQFEVVVVDNNSTVDLFDLAETQAALDSLRKLGVPFRCVLEPRQGSTYARDCGVMSAAGEAVCFLDDDNEPTAEYLASGLAAFADASVGVLVSRVFPAYVEEPSPAVRRREHLLAMNYALGGAAIRWPAEQTIAPTLSAGMWIRKSLYGQIRERFGDRLMPGRIGNALVCGEDIELGIAAGKLGFDRMYVPGLVILHHIPEVRVRPEYITRLIAGIVRSQATLDAKYLNRRPGLFIRLSSLAVSASAGVIVALVRGDAWSEYRFIVAAAYARFKGAFETHAGVAVGVAEA